MSTLTYSAGLTDAVRSLKQMDAQQLTQMFKDAKWFQRFSLTAEEGQLVKNQFSKSSSNAAISKPMELWS
jgi:hypothetical protein